MNYMGIKVNGGMDFCSRYLANPLISLHSSPLCSFHHKYFTGLAFGASNENMRAVSDFPPGTKHTQNVSGVSVITGQHVSFKLLPVAVI